MSKGLPRSRARGAPAQQNIRKTRVTLTGTITVDGASGVGFGTKVIGDLPEGNILLLGAAAYVKLVGPTSANLSDTFAATFAIGSAPTADATLSGGEVDLIAGTTMAAATAEASVLTRAVNATQVMLDNTDNSLELNLNVTIPDLDIGANGIVLTVSGVFEVAYIVMLDD